MTTNCVQPFNPEDDYLASNTFDGNGVTTTFTFTFDYLLRSQFNSSDYSTAASNCHPNIAVLVDNVRVSYYMPSQYTVVLSSAPASGTSNIVIRRESFLSERKVNYTGGSVITESNLDKDGNQAQFLIQELADRLNDQQCQIESSHNINNYFYGPVNGSQTVFPLNYTASGGTSEETSLLSAGELEVVFNGTMQQSRSTVYTTSMISGILNVTFASAPALNTLIQIRTLASGISQRVNIVDGDVTTNKIADHAVTFVKTDFDGAGSDSTFLCQRSGTATWDYIDPEDITSLQAYIRANKVTDLTAPTTSFSMNSQKITNLATPTNAGDAVTKGYVDDLGVGVSEFYIAAVTVTGTVATITSPFTPDFVEVLVDGQAVSGSLEQVSTSPTTTIPHSKMFTWATLSSPQTFAYRVAPGSGYYQITISKSGNVISFITAGYFPSGQTVNIFAKCFKNG